jgi:hypothetical protein
MKFLVNSLLLTLAILVLLGAVWRWMPVEQRTAWLSMLPASQGKISEPAARPADENEFSESEQEEEEAPQRLVLINGAPAVKLTAWEQRYSGIRTAPLKRITYQAERRAYGEVVDIRPLLALRARYAQAFAQQQIAAARLQVSAQEYERLRGINEQGNVISESRMRQAQSRAEVDQAQLSAAETRTQNIRAQAIQSWGEALTVDALDADSERMQRLIAREEVLLRITLPPGRTLASSVRTAYIERNGVRRRAREASLISPAPRADPAAQGETWFYRSAAEGLRTGMRVAAWMPQAEAPVAGVLLPARATVWYGGEPWIYVNVDEELFARRAVPRAHEIDDGWVAHQGFAPGERVVVRGGQMLLSEEFRWQIPEEDDD